MIYGYACVSTNGQRLAPQASALEGAGVEKLFSKNVSWAQVKRRQLELCLGSLKEGDTLVVTRLDNLARSMRDLRNTVERISEAGAEIGSVAEVLADTTTSTGRLILTVLGGIAEFERDLIQARIAEGHAGDGGRPNLKSSSPAKAGSGTVSTPCLSVRPGVIPAPVR